MIVFQNTYINSLMDKLKNFLETQKATTQEGGLDTYKEQEKILTNLINSIGKDKLNILEIGFNAGFSSELFLEISLNSTVVSFDLNVWSTVSVAKQWIDQKYKGRHTLIVGDSRQTVPDFYNHNPMVKFDLLFVDGGHHYDIVKEDMTNVNKMANKETIIVLDDVCRLRQNIRSYTEGPTLVWNEFLSQNKLIEISQHEENGRGFVWGKFLNV